MRHLILTLGVVFAVACLSLLATIQGWSVGVAEQLAAMMQRWMEALNGWFLGRLEQAGYFAIGWGTGAIGWFLSGNLAASYLLLKVPTVSKLWEEDVLTSRLPVLKYLAAGGLFLGFGGALGCCLWGLFNPAFDVGLLVGAIFSLARSLRRVSQSRENRVDFLEANQRYLNEEKVSLFSDD